MGILGFNPRTRTGCDGLSLTRSLALVVSTHAPARGATDAFQEEHQQGISFNPRTRTGCDASYHLSRIPAHTQFQPTHPHAVRPRYNILTKVS